MCSKFGELGLHMLQEPQQAQTTRPTVQIESGTALTYRQGQMTSVEPPPVVELGQRWKAAT